VDGPASLRCSGSVSALLRVMRGGMSESVESDCDRSVSQVKEIGGRQQARSGMDNSRGYNYEG